MTMPSHAPLPELRVLTGPQTGASIALSAGATIDVGSLSASGCQVVLRDPRVAEQRLRLHVRAFDVRIDVLVGTVDMAGQVLVAPCSIDWPHFMPVRVGDTVMAVGDADSPRWDQVLAVAEAAPRADLPVPEAHAERPPAPASAPAVPVVARARRTIESWLAIGGATVAVIALGLMAFVSIATPAGPGPITAALRLERLLLAPEFRGLRSERTRDEGLRITGTVRTLGDRARLDRSLAEARIEAGVSVQVGEQIALAVRDVFRMNGVMAEATVPATLEDVGRVRVTTASADLPHLARIEAVVRQDVQGLQALLVENTVPAATPVATVVPDDPGKRIASIVPGDVAYVVTVDGTRYFPGALLPSGHRITSIAEAEVLLEKDGKSSPLKF
jgi:type III secretion protein D